MLFIYVCDVKPLDINMLHMLVPAIAETRKICHEQEPEDIQLKCFLICMDYKFSEHMFVFMLYWYKESWG